MALVRPDISFAGLISRVQLVACQQSYVEYGRDTQIPIRANSSLANPFPNVNHSLD